MFSFARIISSVLIWAMLVSPTYAQISATSSTTTPRSPSRSSGGDSGLGVGLGIGAGILGLGLLSGLNSTLPVRKFTSFGGRVVTAIPCVSGLGPSIHITVIPAGIFPVTYIWTPATFTFSAGPPRTPGQQVLGLADVPFFCTIGVPPFLVPLFGLRMFTVGTSVAI